MQKYEQASGKDFLALDEISAADLEAIARRAIALSVHWDGRTLPQVWPGGG